MKPAIVVVINALHSGGAEQSCVELIRALRNDYDFTVFSLLGGGPTEQELRTLGVNVVLLQGGGFWRMWSATARLASALRQLRPIAVLTFLYVADFVGGILARIFAPHAQVHWNIRNNVLTKEQTGRLSLLAMHLNARLSRFVPHAITYCSALARTQHECIGYAGRRNDVIENSVASVPFRFSTEARARFRHLIPTDTFVFLFVGRFDPIKRVDVFVDVGAKVASQVETPMRFIIAGSGMDSANDWLRARIEASGHAQAFMLAGFMHDRQALYSGADCLVVTSESEGSPNAVYEAGATALPCIVFATAGTDGIELRGLERIPVREEQLLVAAMIRQLGKGPRPSGRESDARAVPMPPALVEHYSVQLRWARS